MRIETGVATDIGRVREGNEDSYLVEPPVFAVADGMGGHRGGEVASTLALETVEELARGGRGTLAEQVRAANRAVFEKSQTDRAVNGMGTTLTAVRVADDAAYLAHVGDSRAYLMRTGVIRQLTDDHTLVNRMVKAGEITAEEAEVHPHRNVLTRALGTDPDVAVDEGEVGLLDGDRLILCSDGLFGMVAEDQMRAILETEPDPQKAADRLVRAANRAGGVDNITVVILDVHDDGRPVAARTGPARRRRWIAGAVVAVVALAGIFFVGRAYLDAQWYVGVADGSVAIFRGVPAEPLGIRLSHVELQTDIAAAAAERIEFYRNLPSGINTDGRDGAYRLVQRIRADVAAAEKRRGAQP